MFPSKGLFNRIPCPLYHRAGLCERPYCHYSHEPLPNPVNSLPVLPRRESVSHIPVQPVTVTAPPAPVYKPTPKRPKRKPAVCTYTPTPKSVLRSRRYSTASSDSDEKDDVDGSESSKNGDDSKVRPATLEQKKVYSDLFGDDSDNELPAKVEINIRPEDDDIEVVKPPPKTRGAIIDLTASSDEENADFEIVGDIPVEKADTENKPKAEETTAKAEDTPPKEKLKKKDSSDKHKKSSKDKDREKRRKSSSKETSPDTSSNKEKNSEKSGKSSDKKLEKTSSSTHKNSKHKDKDGERNGYREFKSSHINSSQRELNHKDSSLQKESTCKEQKETKEKRRKDKERRTNSESKNSNKKHKGDREKENDKDRKSDKEKHKDREKSKDKSKTIESRGDKSRKSSTEEHPNLSTNSLMDDRERISAIAGDNDDDQCKQLFMLQQYEEQPAYKTNNSQPSESKEESEQNKKRTARELHCAGPAAKRVALPARPRNNLGLSVQNRLTAAAAVATSSPVNKELDYTESRTYKHTNRTAHIPHQKVVKALDKPRISAEDSTKVPSKVRQALLDKFIEECLKIYNGNEKQAFNRAVEEEKVVYNKCNNSKIYNKSAMSTVVKFRREQQQERSHRKPALGQHQVTLLGKAAGNVTVGLNSTRRNELLRKSEKDMIGELLYKKLRSYILTKEQLLKNGFPQPDPEKDGHAVIQWTLYDKVPEIKGNERRCLRCGKTFRIDEDGNYALEDCDFHSSRPFKRKVNGMFEEIYDCCGGRGDSHPCTYNQGHVHDTNKYYSLSGFQQTLPKHDTVDYHGVYALDCEMIYTFKGWELARVTVINDKLEVEYDAIVKPSSQVVCYNTKYSGLQEKDFVDCTTSLEDVQAVLLHMFRKDTILIGHSLNGDLIALKLIHNYVVDTSAVPEFTNQKDPNRPKRALKNLMYQFLNEIIQEAGAEGHNSSEDAAACMKLMKWKVWGDFKSDLR